MLEIYRIYLGAYHTISVLPPVTDASSLTVFHDALYDFIFMSRSVLQLFCEAMAESAGGASEDVDYRLTDRYIDAFLHGRAARRTLGEHFTSMYRLTEDDTPPPSSNEDFTGCFTWFDLVAIIRNAAATARDICDRVTSIEPAAEVSVVMGPRAGGGSCTWGHGKAVTCGLAGTAAPLRGGGPRPCAALRADGCVPILSHQAHLEYLLIELLKNAMRATVEKSVADAEAAYAHGRGRAATAALAAVAAPPTASRPAGGSGSGGSGGSGGGGGSGADGSGQDEPPAASAAVAGASATAAADADNTPSGLDDLTSGRRRKAVPRGASLVDHVPPVRVRIAVGDEVWISIHDRGGGVPADILHGMWSYGYTSAGRRRVARGSGAAVGGVWDASTMDSDRHSELAGYGFGLPLARLYARHLNGGDLSLTSSDGIGTTATVRLRDFSSLRDARGGGGAGSGRRFGAVCGGGAGGAAASIMPPVGESALLGFEPLLQTM